LAGAPFGALAVNVASQSLQRTFLPTTSSEAWIFFFQTGQVITTVAAMTLYPVTRAEGTAQTRLVL